MRKMPDERKYDELSASIDSIVSRGEFTSTGDEELDALARIASGLRGLPSPEFKAQLVAGLLPQAGPRSWWPRRLGKAGTQESEQQLREDRKLNGWIRRIPVISWFRGQRAFLAAGGSSGLVGGACCVSGTTAHVLGLASAGAVTSYIHSTIPYFVALSIAGLAGWLLWALREQGITPATIARTAWRHGIALGGAYGAVFGSSMALTMVMGLY